MTKRRLTLSSRDKLDRHDCLLTVCLYTELFRKSGSVIHNVPRRVECFSMRPPQPQPLYLDLSLVFVSDCCLCSIFASLQLIDHLRTSHLSSICTHRSYSIPPVPSTAHCSDTKSRKHHPRTLLTIIRSQARLLRRLLQRRWSHPGSTMLNTVRPSAVGESSSMRMWAAF